MPVFYATTPWDITQLDFNQGFRTTHSSASTAASPFTPFTSPFPIDGVNYTVASHTVQVETELTVNYGTNTDYLDGSGFTFDGAGNIIGGTVQGIAQDVNGTFTYALAGCSVSALDFWAATQTVGNADDIAMFNLMLAGNVMAGWQLARALLVAQPQLAAGTDVAFMQAKITTARFYADHLLTKAPGMRDSIVEGAESVTALALDAF